MTLVPGELKWAFRSLTKYTAEGSESDVDVDDAPARATAVVEVAVTGVVVVVVDVDTDGVDSEGDKHCDKIGNIDGYAFDCLLRS